MKKSLFYVRLYYALLLSIFVFSNQVFGQTTLYQETFASVTTPNLPGGWSVIGNISTEALNPASPASGGASLFARNCSPSGEARSATVAGISTLGASSLSLEYYHRGTASFTPTISLEWSDDGTIWHLLSSYTKTTTDWSLQSISLPSGAENISSLSIRWSYQTDVNNSCTVGTPNYRIDDLRITALVLPVELSSFTASAQGSSVDLRWETASEQNNAYFSVEKSEEGSKYREIGRVAGHGNSNGPNTYGFVDPSPAPGIQYYRLRQMDFDGRQQYSPVVSVDVAGAMGRFSAFPTLVEDQVTLRFPAEQRAGGLLQVFDQAGRLAKCLSLEPGLSEAHLYIGELSTGTYFLRLPSERGLEVFRIYKQ